MARRVLRSRRPSSGRSSAALALGNSSIAARIARVLVRHQSAVTSVCRFVKVALPRGATPMVGLDSLPGGRQRRVDQHPQGRTSDGSWPNNASCSAWV